MVERVVFWCVLMFIYLDSARLQTPRIISVGVLCVLYTLFPLAGWLVGCSRSLLLLLLLMFFYIVLCLIRLTTLKTMLRYRISCVCVCVSHAENE